MKEIGVLDAMQLKFGTRGGKLGGDIYISKKCLIIYESLIPNKHVVCYFGE